MSSKLANVSDLPLRERRAILSELLRDDRGGAEAFPLSFAQQRLWFLAQLEPDNPSYNIPQTLRLKGALNVDILEQAINTIVARHDSLRTVFKEVNGQPIQIVSPEHHVKLLVTDLKELPTAQREPEARRLAISEAQRPFDLTRDYSLRAGLVRIDDDDHWLLLTMHHIASDGWSMGLLTRELSVIYESLATNQPIDLPELPIQYGDFAEWQREWLEGELLEQQLSYWLDSLAGAPAELELPTDRPRPAQQSFRGASLSLRLSQKLSESLSEFSRREGVTLFMTTLAVFQTLLFRYTGQQDIVVGTPIAGRNRVEIENLIGFFVNTLALRTNVSDNPTFRQLLARVKEVALGAYAHQDLPFEKLVEELNPERNVSHSPIFQVVFGMQNAPRESPSLSGLTITRVTLPSMTAKFDLSLFLSESAGALNCWLEYNTDLFEESTIARMLSHFERLLQGIVDNPEKRLSTFPLLTDAERAQLLVQWNHTETEYGAGRRIHEVFERQVERMPDSIATVSETERLSYIELNRRANQLAHYLQKRGVGPGETVGLCVERSNEMLVGMLAILKAGGAYLPLDPAYPIERLSFMLEDGRTKVLLTQEDLQERLPAQPHERIFIDKDWEAIARESADTPESAVTSENLAYVMYTSGSTGEPKAVGVTHRSVLRLVKETNYAQFGANEVFLQFAPLSFDASTFEIWGSLLNGGRLVLMPPGLESLTKLGEAIKQHGVSTLWLTASLFQQMVETELESLRGIRQLLAGGEVLSVPHVERAARELKGCQLINGYGPTENTTFTCCYRVKPDEQFSGSVPIGFPVSNTKVYILDDELEPVPIGVVGELYAGGAGLAVGYLNDSPLTAQRFVPDPLSGSVGARLYRTGDLARYRADGSIEFVGRMDHQVKLRGHRIELGEIETAIKKHPSVQDAVVMLQQSPPENKYLVGYVVNGSSQTESKTDSLASELKALLKKTLPDYTVPAYFVFLEKFPLTSSGKIDRRALLHAGGTSPQLEEAHIAPRDDLEKQLATIWERLLGVQSVGIRDDFFHLGGHSLLAVRLVSEIQKVTGKRLPLVSFFQGANIEYLASLLRQDVRSLSWPTMVQIQTGGPNPPLFCVSMPNVNALGYRSLARYLGNDQPVFGLQAQFPEDLEGEHSQAAVTRIATDYLDALRALHPTGPYQLIGLCRGAHIAYEMACRLEREGHEIPLLGIIDTWVMENTYNYFWRFKYNASGIIVRMLRGIKKEFGIVNKKPQEGASNNGDKTSTLVPSDYAERKQKTFKVYFPGPDYVAPSFHGRIAVFRTQRQPRSRIRDAHLGWDKLAKGGVDIHIIPGDHDSVLKEPNVQGLAEALRKCLRLAD